MRLIKLSAEASVSEMCKILVKCFCLFILNMYYDNTPTIATTTTTNINTNTNTNNYNNNNNNND